MSAPPPPPPPPPPGGFRGGVGSALGIGRARGGLSRGRGSKGLALGSLYAQYAAPDTSAPPLPSAAGGGAGPGPTSGTSSSSALPLSHPQDGTAMVEAVQTTADDIASSPPPPSGFSEGAARRDHLGSAPLHPHEETRHGEHHEPVANMAWLASEEMGAGGGGLPGATEDSRGSWGEGRVLPPPVSEDPATNDFIARHQPLHGQVISGGAGLNSSRSGSTGGPGRRSSGSHHSPPVPAGGSGLPTRVSGREELRSPRPRSRSRQQHTPRSPVAAAAAAARAAEWGGTDGALQAFGRFPDSPPPERHPAPPPTSITPDEASSLRNADLPPPFSSVTAHPTERKETESSRPRGSGDSHDEERRQEHFHADHPPSPQPQQNPPRPDTQEGYGPKKAFPSPVTRREDADGSPALSSRAAASVLLGSRRLSSSSLSPPASIAALLQQPHAHTGALGSGPTTTTSLNRSSASRPRDQLSLLLGRVPPLTEPTQPRRQLSSGTAGPDGPAVPGLLHPRVGKEEQESSQPSPSPYLRHASNVPSFMRDSAASRRPVGVPSGTQRELLAALNRHPTLSPPAKERFTTTLQRDPPPERHGEAVPALLDPSEGDDASPMRTCTHQNKNVPPAMKTEHAERTLPLDLQTVTDAAGGPVPHTDAVWFSSVNSPLPSHQRERKDGHSGEREGCGEKATSLRPPRDSAEEYPHAQPSKGHPASQTCFSAPYSTTVVKGESAFVPTSLTLQGSGAGERVSVELPSSVHTESPPMLFGSVAETPEAAAMQDSHSLNRPPESSLGGHHPPLPSAQHPYPVPMEREEAPEGGVGLPEPNLQVKRQAMEGGNLPLHHDPAGTSGVTGPHHRVYSYGQGSMAGVPSDEMGGAGGISSQPLHFASGSGSLPRVSDSPYPVPPDGEEGDGATPPHPPPRLPPTLPPPPPPPPPKNQCNATTPFEGGGAAAPLHRAQEDFRHAEHAAELPLTPPMHFKTSTMSSTPPPPGLKENSFSVLDPHTGQRTPPPPPNHGAPHASPAPLDVRRTRPPPNRLPRRTALSLFLPRGQGIVRCHVMSSTEAESRSASPLRVVTSTLEEALTGEWKRPGDGSHELHWKPTPSGRACWDVLAAMRDFAPVLSRMAMRTDETSPPPYPSEDVMHWEEALQLIDRLGADVDPTLRAVLKMYTRFALDPAARANYQWGKAARDELIQLLLTTQSEEQRAREEAEEEALEEELYHRGASGRESGGAPEDGVANSEEGARPLWYHSVYRRPGVPAPYAAPEPLSRVLPPANLVQPFGSAAVMSRLEMLLCTGQREAAAALALQNGLYADALIISLVCATPEHLQRTVEAYTLQYLHPYAPLAQVYRTFTEMPSCYPPDVAPPLPVQAMGRQKATDHRGGGRRARPPSLKWSWRRHAALQLAAYSSHTPEQLIALSDALLVQRELQAAHTCLLLCDVCLLARRRSQQSYAADASRDDASLTAGSVLDGTSQLSETSTTATSPGEQRRMELCKNLQLRLNILGGHFSSGSRAGFLSPLTTTLTTLLQACRRGFEWQQQQAKHNTRTPVDGPLPCTVIPARTVRYAVCLQLMGVWWLKEAGLNGAADAFLREAALQGGRAVPEGALLAPPTPEERASRSSCLMDLACGLSGVPLPTASPQREIPSPAGGGRDAPPHSAPPPPNAASPQPQQEQHQTLALGTSKPMRSTGTTAAAPSRGPQQPPPPQGGPAGSQPAPSSPPDGRGGGWLSPSSSDSSALLQPSSSTSRYGPKSNPPAPSPAGTNNAAPPSPTPDNEQQQLDRGDTTAAKKKERSTRKRANSLETIRNFFFRGRSSSAEGGKEEEKTKPVKKMILDTEKPPAFDPATGRWLFEQTEEEKAQAALIKNGPPKPKPKPSPAPAAADPEGGSGGDGAAPPPVTTATGGPPRRMVPGGLQRRPGGPPRPQMGRFDDMRPGAAGTTSYASNAGGWDGSGTRSGAQPVALAERFFPPPPPVASDAVSCRDESGAYCSIFHYHFGVKKRPSSSLTASGTGTGLGSRGSVFKADGGGSWRQTTVHSDPVKKTVPSTEIPDGPVKRQKDALSEAYLKGKLAEMAEMMSNSPVERPQLDPVTEGQEFRFPNGDCYLGAKRREGYGRYVWKDGSWFQGEYANGVPNGLGTRYYHLSGGMYHGEFRNAQKNGKGTYWWGPGSPRLCHVGHYVKGNAEGWGVETLANGQRHIGQWRDCRKCGWGRVEEADGTVLYEGEWSHNMVDGHLDTLTGVSDLKGGWPTSHDWIANFSTRGTVTTRPGEWSFPPPSLAELDGEEGETSDTAQELPDTRDGMETGEESTSSRWNSLRVASL